MTKENKLEILNRVEEKCYMILDNLDGPDLMTAEAHQLTDVIHSLNYLQDLNREPKAFIPPDTPLVENQPVVEAEKVDEPVEKSPEKVDEPAEQEETDRETYTLETVRSILRDKQLAGEINMEEIFENIGYAKLSEVPKEKYGELLKLAGAL